MPSGVTRILGIDPGSRITGFGVIDVAGAQQAYVASGCIRTQGGSLPERIRILLDGIRQVVETYRPDIAAVEIVFVNVNPQSTLMLGQARGAVVAGLVAAGLPVAEYTALQVKQAVVGNGHADKDQVSHMVQRLLRLTGRPQADAADALGVAITHAQHSGGAAKQLAAYRQLSMKRGRMA